MAKSKKAPPKKKVTRKPKKDWRDDVKKMLLQMRKELLLEVTQTMRAESDHLKFDIGDFYDHASTDRDRELALMLADREREKLTHVDDALKRIESGTYGICESCEEEIDRERLAAMPFTKLCLSCQEDLERQ
ncbi:MAG: TraR/DksA C4-type zinc finger protein [Candidatus Dadabacteria bacterium]|jgi:DnaK suppressor protein|nr:TraR/DksA C4-type zinc finger protein [Candidatus Dadabacteria bacterium]HSC34090.1 TraR/DksA C4-type zinc finger protein [Thermodesulfobacteriota bacterium]